jgi:hypothetical protein
VPRSAATRTDHKLMNGRRTKSPINRKLIHEARQTVKIPK